MRVPMNTHQRRTLLSRLTGHLVAGTPQQERDIQALLGSLSRCILTEDLKQLKGSQFAFEDADRFSEETIPAERISALQAIAERGVAEEPEFRFFLREVP